jgi:DNA-binding transcriptional ArsR family regulator
MSTPNDVCQSNVIHEDKVRKIKKQMLQDFTIQQLSETFGALSEPTRVKILHALSNSELCVCDISAILDMSISAVSHQLRVLRNMRLVKFRKSGKMVYYSLDDKHIGKLFKIAHEHVSE